MGLVATKDTISALIDSIKWNEQAHRNEGNKLVVNLGPKHCGL